MRHCTSLFPRLAAFLILVGIVSPALAHEPILKCVLLDENSVRCRGGYGHGEGAPDKNLEVVDYAGKTLLAGKLDSDSTLTFPRPKGGYYVLFDVGPGHQAIVEHDEIRRPRSSDRAMWVRR